MTRSDRCLSFHYLRRGLLSGLLISLLGVVLIAVSMGLSGCESSDSNSNGTSETGDIVIGLTDDEGDFVRYTVEVLSLTLTKKNGAVVETLPLTTQVDFAQYTDITEFLTAATIPSGLYTKATITLDYQDADIWVEDSNGDSVKVETIQDENGNPISTLELSVHLEDKNSLVIAPGIPAHLTLDFDLNASNRVEFNGGSPVLTVQPVLLADVNPEAPKIHRLRGPLKDVDVDEGTFSVIIRPFIHILTGADERFGVLEVVTNDSTVCDIDGELYQGEEGLIALDSMPVFTATVVVGDLKFNPVRFEAREVYAGSSVPGGTLDVVTGNVISREGDAVTMKGATLIRAEGSVVFNNTLTIQLGEATRVTRQLSTVEYNIDDISVGQRIMAFGTLNNEETQLDATEGYVRMLLTTLRGTAINMDTPWLVVDLAAINGRRAGIFDFSGTGTDPDHDADPSNYEINTGALDISSLSSATPVKVYGFVQAFGQAPEDFDAQTIVDVSGVTALMTLNWRSGTAEAFETLSAEGITLNLEGVGIFHHVGRSGVVIDLTELSNSPSILPKEEREGLFSIAQNGTTQLFFTFEDFTSDLEERIEGGAEVKHIVATGSFNDAAATLTSGYVAVKLQ